MKDSAGDERNPRHARLSVVVPVFNEEQSVAGFVERMRPVLERWSGAAEMVFVNDGSDDGTLGTLRDLKIDFAGVRVVDLSRNFGKDIAMTAGLDHAKGDVVVPMDVDLQDPPDLILEFVERWREGYDVVYGRRRTREGDSLSKRLTANAFYRVFNLLSMNPIPPDAGDFRLMDRQVVEAVRRMPERDRFMKGMFAWVGFRSTSVDFDRGARASGGSGWSFWTLLRFGLAGIFSFSVWPLRIWSLLGGAVALLSFLYGAFLVARTLILGVDVPGYASIIVSILFIGGANLVGIGFLGEYLARVYMEVKQRPLYLVRRVYSGEPGDA